MGGINKMFNELKNLSLDIKAKQEIRTGLKDDLTRQETKKTELLKGLEEIKFNVESTILLGSTAKEYKNEVARKVAIKTALTADYDFIKFNERLESACLEIKKLERDLRVNQVEIEFLSREFDIYLALANQNNKTVSLAA